MAPGEALARIHARLGAAEERLDPGVERTRVAIRRARVRIEGLVGDPQLRGGPPEGMHPGETPLEQLQAADAIAREHLGEAGLEGQIRRAVGEALSAAREELKGLDGPRTPTAPKAEKAAAAHDEPGWSAQTRRCARFERERLSKLRR